MYKFLKWLYHTASLKCNTMPVQLQMAARALVQEMMMGLWCTLGSPKPQKVRKTGFIVSWFLLGTWAHMTCVALRPVCLQVHIDLHRQEGAVLLYSECFSLVCNLCAKMCQKGSKLIKIFFCRFPKQLSKQPSKTERDEMYSLASWEKNVLSHETPI